MNGTINKGDAVIEKQIKKSAGSLLTNIEVFDVYTGEHVDENKKSIAYSLTFSDSKKTLTDDLNAKEYQNILNIQNKYENEETKKK